MSTRLGWIVVALVGGTFAGCQKNQGEAGQDAANGAATTTDSGFRQRDLADLPAVGDPLPPLGAGQLEIAGPQNWRILSRNNTALARFVKGNADDLPRITVTEAPSPQPDLGDTTEDTADSWAEHLGDELKSDKKKHVHEPCLPIVLGETIFIRHVRAGSLAGSPVVIQSLQTAKGGRLYTVELICEVNHSDSREYGPSLKAFRDQGYAVAANMQWGGSTPAPAEVPAETPVEPPAEK